MICVDRNGLTINYKCILKGLEFKSIEIPDDFILIQRSCMNSSFSEVGRPLPMHPH